MKKLFNEICSRCGSKKRIAKTWKETIVSYERSSQIEISQIVCTNKACQTRFDENRAIDIKQYEDRKKKTEEKLQLKKETMLRAVEERKLNFGKAKKN